MTATSDFLLTLQIYDLHIEWKCTMGKIYENILYLCVVPNRTAKISFEAKSLTISPGFIPYILTNLTVQGEIGYTTSKYATIKTLQIH